MSCSVINNKLYIQTFLVSKFLLKDLQGCFHKILYICTHQLGEQHNDHVVSKGSRNTRNQRYYQIQMARQKQKGKARSYTEYQSNKHGSVM